MTHKRIFILNGHPAESSLNRTLAESYADAARAAGHEVRLTHLHDLTFDPDYGFGGYENQKPLEAELEHMLDDIAWSEHVVLTTPMWWGGLPANLAGIQNLKQYMAAEIGVEDGEMIVESKGLHLYGYAEELAKLRCLRQ